MPSETRLAIATRTVVHFYEIDPFSGRQALIDTDTMWFNRLPEIGDEINCHGRPFKVFSVNDLRDINGLVEAKILAQ